MSDIADLGFRVDPTGIVKGTKALTRLDDAGNRVLDTSKLMEVGFKAAATGAAALAAATVAGVNKYKQYGTALAEVNTLLDNSWSTDSLDQMSEGVRELTKQMGGDVVQNTKALYQVISAGASDATEAIETLTQANKLAIGGVASIEGSVDGLTSSMNAYAKSGLTAADASDSMFVAVKKGKTTIEELSSIMGRTAPLAAAVGVSFDEVNAAIATLTTTGTATSEAGTGLVGVMKALVKVTPEAAKQAKAIGLEFNLAAIESKGFAGFIEDVATKTQGSTEILGKLFGEVEGLKAVMQLGGDQAETFASILEAMGVKAGATDAAFLKMTTGTARLGFEWENLKAKTSDYLITLGERAAPILLGVKDNIEKIGSTLLDAGKAAVVFGSSFAAYKLLPGLFASITASAGYAANAISMIGVRGAASVATMNLLSVAGAGVSKALALIGGPAGLAAIAAVGLYGMATASTAAETQSKLLTEQINGFSGALDVSIAKTQQQVQEMNELNLISERNVFAGITEDIGLLEREVIKSEAAIAQLKEVLKLDNLSNDLIKSSTSEIAIYKENISAAELEIRKLNLQQELSEGRFRELQKATTKISEVTVTMTKRTQDSTSASQLLSGALKKQKNAADLILESDKKRKDAIKQLTSAISDGKDQNGLLRKELERLDGTTEKLTKEERLRLKGLEESKRAAKELARATGSDLLRSQEQLNTALDQAEQYTRNYEKSLQQAKLAILSRGGVVEGTKEWDKALEGLGFSVDDAGDKTTKLGAIWERTTDSMFNTGQDFFRSALDGWDGFKNGADSAFDSIKDAFKDLVASLLAQWATSGLVGLLNGEGFSGFTLNNAFGDGSKGSAGAGIAAIFGSNAGQRAVGAVVGQEAGQSFANVVNTGGQAFGAGVGAYNSYNQIDQGLEQGGSQGALSVVSGVAGLYRTYQQALAVYQGLTTGANAIAAIGGTVNTTVAATQGANAALSGLNATLQAVNTLPATVQAGSAAAQAVNGTQAVVQGGNIAGGGSAASAGSGLSAGLGATAAWVGVGLLVDKYLNDGRVANAASQEHEIRYQGIKDLFDGDFGAFSDSIFKAGVKFVDASFGGRSTDELGSDQLREVLKNIEKGVIDPVAVGGGQGANFLGGFNDETVFFNAITKGVDLDKVSALLAERLQNDDIRAIGDEIIRIENRQGSFAADSDKVIKEVLRAVAEVEIGFTELEVNSVKSLGAAFFEMDKIFDASLDSGLTTQERVLDSISKVYSLSTDEAKKWASDSGLEIERFGEIFQAGNEDVISSVVDNFKFATESISGDLAGLGDNAYGTFGIIQGGLTGIRGSVSRASAEYIEARSNLTSIQGSQQQVSQDAQRQERLIAANERNAEAQARTQQELSELARQIRNTPRATGTGG